MKDHSFKQISIVGAGTMGAQIALQCAVHGYPVQLFSRSDETLNQARQLHTKEMDKRISREQLTHNEKNDILTRLHLTTNLQTCVHNADLVIENVPEKLEIKRTVFGQLDQLCPPHTVLATDSSSLRIARIEDATQRPDQVLNMHFYQPVWYRPLVELMGGTQTNRDTLIDVYRFATSIGMHPILLEQESLGFLYNRIWRAIKKECLKIVDAGVASPEDVDRACKLMGMTGLPFASMDMVGLDVIRDIEMVYYDESGLEDDAPPPFLGEMIERGELGLKRGKGFYEYPNPAYRDPDWLKPPEK
ncbi:MAG: 3-hydroxyacyl-CoA dehydrogenase family protein [Chloroflexota bacterium]